MSAAPYDTTVERGRVFAYRPALDGVRALAVAAVLLFHGGLAALPGGFLGVDAFFVLSGFLITSLLLAEHARDGRIRLGRFWLRRVRRLLPALLMVLAVVVLVWRPLFGEEDLSLLRGDALAALAYLANWRMIYRGEGYFAENATPSPLQHTWSLGIEEQFYLLWPLIVIGVLAVALVAARHRRAVLLGVCVTGAVSSAVAAALVFRAGGVDRAYFGTDTRAQALLIGCALAVGLAIAGDRAQRGGRWLGAAAVAGAAVVVTLWAGIDGTDPALYQGGLALGALAVAGVIAHAVVSPRSPTARVLSLPPLVWLGKISYGLYLWHWPLFQFVNADRTGLTGPALLGLRCALTVAVAAVSYLLVEEPIRSGRWPLRLPLPPPGRWAAGLAGATAVALTAFGVVRATAAPSEPAVVGMPPIPTVDLTRPATGPGAPTSPLERRDRRPGPVPRVTFFGDSVSWSLGNHLPPDPRLAVTVRTVNGCGIVRLPEFVQLDGEHTIYERCPNWPYHWSVGISEDDPDLAVVLLDRWELMDRKLNGVYQHVGQPAFDAYLETELAEALRIVTGRGAHVALLTAPYTRRAERPDGGLYPEDRPERVDAWNTLLRRVAARYPGTVHLLDLNRHVCPEGRFTWDVGALRIRSDGLHFTPRGVREWIAPWLLPQLLAMAGDPAATTPSPGHGTAPRRTPGAD